AAPAGGYCVGAAKREITPRSPVYLGGYGFGPVRKSVGVASPLWARALAIARGGTTVVLCAIDTQGHFLAYQAEERGSQMGFAAIRRRVAQDRGLPERNLILAATHDHSGPDDAGLWGGVPAAYLQLVAAQTVAAIEAAIQAERPATLYRAEVDTAPVHLLRNLLPPSYPLDTELRTIFARDGRGQTFAALVNFSAHVAVLGKDNRLVSPDWPGAAANAIERSAPGSVAVVMVGSVGRTLPDLTGIAKRGPAAVEEYGDKVAKLALHSEAGAELIDGPIAASETVLEEPIDNRVLASLTTGGIPGADRVMRANRPPYLEGHKIRTVVGAMRIGALFLAAVPGESFPETEKLLEERVASQGHLLFSLAEDELGYDPPPYEVGLVEYFSPLDEGLFIISPSFGTDVTRALLAEAAQLGFPLSDNRYTDYEHARMSILDSVKASIGALEEPLCRGLILIALWLGWNRFS
ncbi:MAG: hypothetical protein WA005_05320, partial [Candidatus Binataceae bacterium]